MLVSKVVFASILLCAQLTVAQGNEIKFPDVFAVTDDFVPVGHNSKDDNSKDEVVVGMKPYYKEYAKVARWLTAKAGWGVLATSGKDYNKDVKGGAPFANVMSYADAKKGVPIFYLTTLDATARDLAKAPMASFSISEASLLGGCSFIDAEEPICAKVTFTGEVKPLKGDDKISAAKKALFKKHPVMMAWPKEHGFTVYTMDIKKIFFLDMYGGAPSITVKEYLNVTL